MSIWKEEKATGPQILDKELYGTSNGKNGSKWSSPGRVFQLVTQFQLVRPEIINTKATLYRLSIEFTYLGICVYIVFKYLRIHIFCIYIFRGTYTHPY